VLVARKTRTDGAPSTTKPRSDAPKWIIDKDWAWGQSKLSSLFWACVAVLDRNPILFRNAIIEISAVKNFTRYLTLCDSYDHAAKISSKMDPFAKKKKQLWRKKSRRRQHSKRYIIPDTMRTYCRSVF